MNIQRLLICISAAGLALLILDYIRVQIIKQFMIKLELTDISEPQFLSSFLVNFVFCVMLPAVVYSALYPILPFTNYLAGIFIALFVFGVGQLPQSIRTYNQYRLSSALSAFELFWNLLTLLVTLGIIAYLYRY